MSKIEAACQIVSSVGCFADADLEVTDPEYFANIDRLNRIHAAAGELWDFVEDGLGDGHGAELLRKVRCLVAAAMVEQQKFDEQEYARREPPRLSISLRTAVALKALLDDLVEEGGEANV
jgi:hypothetical protein